MTDFKEGRIARGVYEAWRNGDRISDRDLLMATAYFRDLADKLLPLGDTFRLTCNEANRCHQGLESFVKARGLDKTLQS